MMDSSPGYTDSPECDRNPSPPPELTENPDLLLAESVGNTAFSKHWLFTTLIKLIEEVDRENEEDSNLAVDVDEELQNELCKLWDMSMNSDVAKFLNEFKAVEILSGIIDKSKAPRVIEISVGILGNMACEQTVCREMADNPKFIQLVLLLMDTRDVPTLVENTRLIYTSLSGVNSRQAWIKAIQRSEDFLNHLMFIFSSSTNYDLLKNSAELVDILLDQEPDLCVSWATIEFIHSLLEATDQIGSGHTEALEVYLHIFQSFSTSESGVEALVAHIERLEKKIIKYLNIVCEYEIVGLDGKEDPLSSALSVLHISLTSRSRDKLQHLYKDESIMRILLKILEPLYPMLKKYKEAVESNQGSDEQENDETNAESGQSDSSDNNGSSENVAESRTLEDDKAELRQLEVLYETLSSFLLEYCGIAFEDPDKTGEEDDKSTTSPNTDTPEKSECNPEKSECDPKKSECDPKKSESDQSSKDNEDNMCSESDSKTADNLNYNAGKDEVTEGQGDASSANDTSKAKDSVPILTYLDESCSRWRINNLALTLKESDNGNKVFQQLVSLSKHHSKERLCRILNDVSAGKIVNRAESTQNADEHTA